MFKTIRNTFKTVALEIKLRCYCWVVNNLESDVFELETIKKNENLTFQDKHDLTVEIIETQKELIKMKKKILLIKH